MHETPFVDVADGIDGDDDGWHSTGAYCTAKPTFSHSSLVKVWGAYCTSVRIVFEILRYIHHNVCETITIYTRNKTTADTQHPTCK